MNAEWELRWLDPAAEPSSLFAEEIQKIFRDGFGIEGEGWKSERIKKTLGRCNALGLLLGKGREVYGYALYSFPDTQLLGAWVLWEDAIALRKEAQRHGLSKQVLELARGFYPGRRFGWIGGRTQNPAMMRRYNKQGLCYPFDVAYTEGDGPKVVDFLTEHIDEVKNVLPSFDRSTGICAGAYIQGILGDYSWDDTGHYESRLLQWGFDRSRGDAIIVVARVETA
jgi:hypothetical protein